MRGLYKLCELTRPHLDGVAQLVTWIPAEIAHLGRTVTLKDPDTGHRTAGWKVHSVGEPGRAFSTLQHRSRDHLKTRDASDI